MISPSIFKAYDIRGIYEQDIDEEGAYILGRAFATLVNSKQVVVGYDMRTMAKNMVHSLIQGITEQGVSVINIGMVTTDTLYFACQKHDVPGIMNTASHNPGNYTGFKMVKKMPQLIGKGSGMEELKDLCMENNFISSENKGIVEEDADIMHQFVMKVLSTVDISSLPPLKIVIDAGNGMGGMISEILFHHIPQIEIVPLFFEPDGTFPNHLPDPLIPENKDLLEKKVLSSNADLGIAFDGDADRCFFVDSTGYAIPGDFLTALFAEWFCAQEKNAKVIYDPRASDAVVDTVEKNGGIALIERVGHTFIKKRMMEENAIFAGEVSAHYYFRDLGGFDSGIAAAVTLLAILAHKNQTLAQCMTPFKEKYFISGEINSSVHTVALKLQKIEDIYKEGEIQKIDGVSIRFPDFHFNVRGSNTEPLIRLNLEGKTQEIMEQKTQEVLRLIRDP